MSEEQKAQARAEGAFHNFIEAMKTEMLARDRSPEYQEQFWTALQTRMEGTDCQWFI